MPVHRATASRWLDRTLDRAVEIGVIAEGREVGTHTFRHSFVRHMLTHAIPINVLSR